MCTYMATTMVISSCGNVTQCGLEQASGLSGILEAVPFHSSNQHQAVLCLIITVRQPLC